ncbi:MAG: glycosyltransferase family 1 protein [Candidatus Amesbacteria bacterium]|nr:glycosyltransferase family 1 protein [Candidatus Amesbacteria bacterium]
MKVGIDISAIIYGTGVSNYTQELIDHLAPMVDLKTFKFSRYPLSIMEFLWNRLHIINVEIFTGGIDIYHASDWTQAPSKAKKVTTIHDLSPFIYPIEVDPIIVEVHTAKMKWAVKECDAFICVSQSTSADLRRLFNVHPDKIHVIYEAMPSNHKLVPQITRYSNYVLAIGSRQPRKNIERLKKACDLIGQKLIIVGEGSEMGYVTDQDLVNLLAGASAFVYPSIYEGFGLPILEAFYHKIPVACSNTSSLPEVAGDAAIYFDPYNIDQIAKAITEAINNKDKLVALGAKQLAKFSWDKCAKETLEVYKSLVVDKLSTTV